jgi:hypothetical protein
MCTPVEYNIRIILTTHLQALCVWNTLNVWPYTDKDEHRYGRVELEPRGSVRRMAEKKKSRGRVGEEKRIDPTSV